MNMKRIFALLCTSFLFANMISLGVFTAIADDLQVTDTTGVSAGPSVAFDPTNGKIHIAWYDNRDGSYEIYYTYIGGDRFINWQNGTQITNRSGDSTYPSIALDSYGNIHVVWQYYSNGNWDIYYKKLANDGTALTADERVTDDPGNSIRPKITIDSEDNANIVWYDDRYGAYELFWNKRVEPELEPIDLTFDTEDPFEGQTINAYVTVENNGDNDATDFTIDFLIDDSLIDSQTITLSAQSSELLNFSWFTVMGSHQAKIVVDDENVIAEKDETNNFVTEDIIVYRITEFSNISIWANASVTHFVPIDVTIEEVDDPEASGTPNNVDVFVDYTANASLREATIKIGYDEGDLGDLEESTLKMYYYDEYDVDGPHWEIIENSWVDEDNNFVEASVLHFSTFAPIGHPIDADLSSVTLTGGIGMHPALSSFYADWYQFTVTVIDHLGQPIKGIPASDFEFTAALGTDTVSHCDLNSNLEWAPLDTQTDANGEIRWQVRCLTSVGRDSLDQLPNGGYITITASVLSVNLNDSDDLLVSSCDIDLDGDVDLSDFSRFAVDFGLNRQRSDFDYSGSITLSDFSTFAVEFGSRQIC